MIYRIVIERIQKGESITIMRLMPYILSLGIKNRMV